MAAKIATEAFERGWGHGQDAANFDLAYGTDESAMAQAGRRGRDYYRAEDQRPERVQYALGFIRGYRTYTTEHQED